MLPGFGLEISWKGSLFLGEIFSSPRRKTFFSCPNSEKLQGRLFFVFHREGEFLGLDKTKRGWQELYGSCPISHCRPLSRMSPPPEPRKEFFGEGWAVCPRGWGGAGAIAAYTSQLTKGPPQLAEEDLFIIIT